MVRSRRLQHPGWRWSRWLGPLAVPFTVAALWTSTEVYGLRGVAPARLVPALVFTAATLALWGLYFAAVRRNYLYIQATIRRGQCLACGYELRGTVAAGGDTCPECGEPADPAVRRYLEQIELIRRHAAATGTAAPPGPGGP